MAAAEAARQQANEAQNKADLAQAHRYVPDDYQIAQKTYGIGLESLQNQRFQNAAERFADAAGAFIRAASLAEPIRKEQELQAQRNAGLQKAQELATQGKWNDAEKAYQAYFKEYPQDGPAYLEYAFMVFQNISYARGSGELKKAVKMPGVTPAQRGQVHGAIAQWYHSSGHLDKAIAEMQTAISADPTNASLRSALSQYQYEQAEIQRQRAEQQRAIGAIGGALLREALK